MATKAKASKGKNENTSAVAVLNAEATDALAFYQKLEEQLAKCVEIETTQFKIQRPVKFGGQEIDVANHSNIGDLIEMAGAVNCYIERYDKGKEIIGIESAPDAKIDGVSPVDLLEDVKLRTRQLANKSNKKDIKESMAEMEQFFSEDQRMLISANKIKSKLSNQIVFKDED